MLTKLTLHNFKCFDNLELSLSNLNVLTGLNGMGKSTALQSILLLSQSADTIESSNKVILNGMYHEFGICSDILYENAEDDDIEIAYISEDKAYRYQIQYSEYNAENEILPLKTKNTPRPFCDNHLVYLSANRITPQVLYGITDEKLLAGRDFDKSGEYTIQYLDRFQNETVQNYQEHLLMKQNCQVYCVMK